jgi:hypothetical protein
MEVVVVGRVKVRAGGRVLARQVVTATLAADAAC